jgi:FkbM family methyltransferase
MNRTSTEIRVRDTLRFYRRQLTYGWREMRWAWLAGRPRSFVVPIQSGMKMRLYGDSELSRLIYCRDFEVTERAFLNDFLRLGDVFVDVGANIGLFTLIAATRVGQVGRVVSFEPATTTNKRLTDNVRLNDFGNVTCVRAALSDSSGQLELVQSLDGFDAWNSLAKPTMGSTFSNETVDVIAWDRYATQHNLVGAVTMMKIDVEGWESRVLAGGREIFSRADAPLLQVEFEDHAAKTAGSSCRDLYRLLEDFGYRMFVYDAGARCLVREPMRDHYPFQNLVAAKNEEFVNSRLQ